MRARTTMLMAAIGMLCILLSGCGKVDPSAPPAVRLGESVCDECGMIVSDERFASATIINADRGPQTLIFDDYNCQMDFEAAHTDLDILTRWARDYTTLEWFHTRDAWFVSSPQLHTPMASNLAAFKQHTDAQRTAEQLGGETQDFSTLWPAYPPPPGAP